MSNFCTQVGICFPICGIAQGRHPKDGGGETCLNLPMATLKIVTYHLPSSLKKMWGLLLNFIIVVGLSYQMYVNPPSCGYNFLP